MSCGPRTLQFKTALPRSPCFFYGKIPRFFGPPFPPLKLCPVPLHTREHLCVGRTPPPTLCLFLTLTVYLVAGGLPVHFLPSQFFPPLLVSGTRRSPLLALVPMCSPPRSPYSQLHRRGLGIRCRSVARSFRSFLSNPAGVVVFL